MQLRIATSIIVFVLTLLPLGSHAASKPVAWAHWQAFDPASQTLVDHTPWGRFLERYLKPSADGVNRMAYAKVSPADKARLDAYVETLTATGVRLLNRDEQRAFWINLYNALTVQVVLAHYPVDSILDIDISPGLFANGPWGKKLVEIEGEAVSLDDIEHRILRPIWRDPRLHYTINCASIGCPNLQSVPYTAANGDAQLDAAARAYVNHPRGARVQGGRLYVSSIYDWFEDDFGGGEQGVLEHLRRFADADLKTALSAIEDISDDDYDWTLNATE